MPTIHQVPDKITTKLPKSDSCIKPTLATLYAGIFTRSLRRLFDAISWNAQALCNHLFAPGTDPHGAFAGAVDHATRRIGYDCDTAGKLMDQSQSLLPPATPFTSLLEQFIYIPATLADPMRLSTPRLQPTPRTDIASLPLDTALGLRPLLTYLHQHLHEHFSRLQDSQTTHCCFVTFIVGHSTHPSASVALHSHLVSAFTAPPNEEHSTLYIPTDLISGLPTSTAAFLVNPNVLLHLPPYSPSKLRMLPWKTSLLRPPRRKLPRPCNLLQLHASRLIHQKRSFKSPLLLGNQLSQEFASRDSLSTDPVSRPILPFILHAVPRLSPMGFWTFTCNCFN